MINNTTKTTPKVYPYCYIATQTVKFAPQSRLNAGHDYIIASKKKSNKIDFEAF
nr:unnamed protein product [uncultured bacterium]